MYCKTFLVVDATLASDNPLRFRKNLSERIYNRDEKLQYNINREAAKISALPSGKIDKYEFLTGEEILPPDQRRVIKKVKFVYSALGKAFEKQTKTIEDQGEKHIKATGEHGKQLVESNEIVKKDFNIDRDSTPLEEQKKNLMNLLKKNLIFSDFKRKN